jgi:ComF family protein
METPRALEPELQQRADNTDSPESQRLPSAGWREALKHLAPRFWVEKTGKAALDFFYPPQCMTCESATASPHSLCAACWNAMPLISAPYCARLGTPFEVDFGADMLSPAAIADPPRFDRGRAVARHQGTARELVGRFKYGERLDLARLMGAMMARAGRDILDDADLIVPVPLHRLRLWRRRYNQAALLAGEVARETGVSLGLEALQRIKRTPAQVGLGRGERQRNLVGAFRINPAETTRVAGSRVVVIDDVRTTGSTLNACAHILRKAGATRIDVLTFTLVASGED